LQKSKINAFEIFNTVRIESGLVFW